MSTIPTTAQEQIALPGPGRGGEGGTAPTMTELLGMLRRRALLVVVLFVFFAAGAVGGFVGWWTYFPGYESESLIECISNIPHAQLTPEQERLRQDEHERFVLTQARLMKSPTILEEALKLTAVRETQWWKLTEKRRWKQPAEHLIVLTDELRASPVRGTNFLRVAMECRHREDPQIIVRAVVNQWYEAVNRGAAEEFADDALDAAREEQAALETDIEEDRDRLKSMAQRLPAGARQNPGGNVANEQVKQYAEQVAMLQLELSQLEQYRAAYNDPGGVAVTAEDRAAIEQDLQVAELARALFLFQQQRAADEKIFGSGHRVLQQDDAQIEAADAQLAERRMEKLRERRADIREATNTAYDNTRHALFMAQEKLAKAEATLQDQDQLLFEYITIEGGIEDKNKYKLELDTYIKSLSRVKAQRTAINVRVAQPATDPLERSSPSLFLMPLGVFLAMALAVGIALALEMLDTSVKTSQDVVRHVNLALIGLVPDTDDEEVSIERVETAVRDAPRSMVAEAFRGIRTNLQFSAPDRQQRCWVVSSPRPDDGKTTVACNLALAVAQSGRRVLLVDANFYRPRIHQVFEHAPAKGLSNLLVGGGSLSSYVVQTTVPMLEVLGSGPAPPNPVELLGSEACRAFLKEATSRYDQVIIDSAPILLANDAAVLGPVVDGVILVIRANRSSRGVARRACTLLGDVGAHVVGAVLNAARVTRGGYFREQLRDFYDYQADVDATGSPWPALGEGKETPASKV